VAQAVQCLPSKNEALSSNSEKSWAWFSKSKVQSYLHFLVLWTVSLPFWGNKMESWQL
jgi:hypothetical protein